MTFECRLSLRERGLLVAVTLRVTDHHAERNDYHFRLSLRERGLLVAVTLRVTDHHAERDDYLGN
jgi:hypothetical protein